jgi:hypothetical protein
MALLHLLITAIAVSMEIQAMTHDGGDLPALQSIAQFVDGWHPGIAWALMLCAAIFVYLSVVPDRRTKRSGMIR